MYRKQKGLWVYSAVAAATLLFYDSTIVDVSARARVLVVASVPRHHHQQQQQEYRFVARYVCMSVERKSI